MKKLFFVLVCSALVAGISSSAFAADDPAIPIIPATISITTPSDGSTVTSKPATISGESVPMSTITINHGSTTIGTTTSNSLGQWSLSTNNILPGTNTYTVSASRTAAWAFMAPHRETRIDVVDMGTHNFAASFDLPAGANADDITVIEDRVFIGSNSDTPECDIYIYSAINFELIDHIDVAQNCYSRETNISQDGTIAAFLWTDSNDYLSYLDMIDIQTGDLIGRAQIDETDADLEYGINPIVSLDNESVWLHMTGGLLHFVPNNMSLDLIQTQPYSFKSYSNAVLGNDENVLVFGDVEGAINQVDLNNIFEIDRYVISPGNSLYRVAKSVDKQTVFAVAYNNTNFSMFQVEAGTDNVLNETTVDQNPESIATTLDSNEWIVGDNHSAGIIYMGTTGEQGVKHEVQYEGSSYYNPNDDFVTPVMEHKFTTQIILTGTYAGPKATFGSSPEGNTTSIVVGPGGNVDVSGSGFAPETDVTVTLHSTPVLLATVKTNAEGNFTTTLKIPANTALGKHNLVLAGVDLAGQNASVSLDISVSLLPATGTPMSQSALLATFILTAGIVVTGAAKWRRSNRRLNVLQA